MFLIRLHIIEGAPCWGLGQVTGRKWFSDHRFGARFQKWKFLRKIMISEFRDSREHMLLHSRIILCMSLIFFTTKPTPGGYSGHITELSHPISSWDERKFLFQKRFLFHSHLKAHLSVYHKYTLEWAFSRLPVVDKHWINLQKYKKINNNKRNNK